jgi:hypothetical protein
MKGIVRKQQYNYHKLSSDNSLLVLLVQGCCWNPLEENQKEDSSPR